MAISITRDKSLKISLVNIALVEKLLLLFAGLIESVRGSVSLYHSFALSLLCQLLTQPVLLLGLKEVASERPITVLLNYVSSWLHVVFIVSLLIRLWLPECCHASDGLLSWLSSIFHWESASVFELIFHLAFEVFVIVAIIFPKAIASNCQDNSTLLQIWKSIRVWGTFLFFTVMPTILLEFFMNRLYAISNGNDYEWGFGQTMALTSTVFTIGGPIGSHLLATGDEAVPNYMILWNEGCLY